MTVVIKGRTYKVEKDIPPTPYKDNWTSLVRAMEIGDSVIVADSKEAKILKQAMRQHYKRNGLKVKSLAKKWSTERGTEGQYRVWRLDPSVDYKIA